MSNVHMQRQASTISSGGSTLASTSSEESGPCASDSIPEAPVAAIAAVPEERRKRISKWHSGSMRKSPSSTLAVDRQPQAGRLRTVSFQDPSSPPPEAPIRRKAALGDGVDDPECARDANAYGALCPTDEVPAPHDGLDLAPLRIDAEQAASTAVAQQESDAEVARVRASKRASLSRASVHTQPDQLAIHRDARLAKKARQAELKRLPPAEAAKRRLKEWKKTQERDFQQKTETGKYAPGAAKRLGYTGYAAAYAGRDVATATNPLTLFDLAPVALGANLGVLFDAYVTTAGYLQYSEVRGKLHAKAEAADQRLQAKKLELQALSGNADAIAFLQSMHPEALYRLANLDSPQDRQAFEAALREDIADAQGELNSATSACRKEDEKQIVELTKLMRDGPVQLASGAASAANTLEYASRFFDTMDVAVNTAASAPVVSAMSIVGGVIDNVHGKADHAKAKQDLQAARPDYLDAMTALHGAGAPAAGRDNTRSNVASCALKQLSRNLNAVIRRKRTNALRPLKGDVLIGTGVATLILSPLDPSMTVVPSAIGAVNSTLWWSATAANASFTKASKERAQERQRAAKRYLDTHSTAELREMFRDNHRPLKKKGNLIRRSAHLVLGMIKGAPSALRDEQPIDNDVNPHHNPYLACELLARGMAEAAFDTDEHGNATLNTHRHNAFVMLKNDLRVPQQALHDMANLIDSVCQEQENNGTYTLEDRIEHWRQFIAPFMKLKLFSPESLKAGERSPQEKAKILFGRDFFDRYRIKVPKSAAEVLAPGGGKTQPLLVGAAQRYANAAPEHREAILKTTLQALAENHFDTDDFFPMLEYLAAHCVDNPADADAAGGPTKLEAFSASPECELIRALMEHVYRPDASSAEAFELLAESGDRNDGLSRLLRAIQNTAGKISAFNEEAAEPTHVLDLTLDCINVFHDLAQAGLRVDSLDTMLAALDNAKGIGNHRPGKRTALKESIRILRQFDAWQRELTDRTTLDSLVPIARARKHAEAFYGKERAPWEMGRDGMTVLKDARSVLEAAKSRLAGFFGESSLRYRMGSAETHKKWLGMRKALHDDGVGVEALAASAGALHARLGKDDHAGAIWKNGSMALGLLCPPKDARVIGKIVDAAGGMLNEAALAQLVELKTGDPQVAKALDKLGEAGIGRDTMDAILRDQAALPDHARMPATWLQCLKLLAAAAKAPRGLAEFKAKLVHAIGVTAKNPFAKFNALQPGDARVRRALTRLMREGVDRGQLQAAIEAAHRNELSPDWAACLALLDAASRTQLDFSAEEAALREAIQLSGVDLITFYSLPPEDERVKAALQDAMRGGLDPDRLHSMLIRQRAFPEMVGLSPGLLKSIELLHKASEQAAAAKSQRRAAAIDQVHESMRACFPYFGAHVGSYENDLARLVDKGTVFEQQAAAARALDHARKAGFTDGELADALTHLARGEAGTKGVEKPLAHQFGKGVYALLQDAHQAFVNDPERFAMFCRAHDVRTAIRDASTSVAKFNRLGASKTLPEAAMSVGARLQAHGSIGSDDIRALERWFQMQYPAADGIAKNALGDWYRVSKAVGKLRSGMEAFKAHAPLMAAPESAAAA